MITLFLSGGGGGGGGMKKGEWIEEEEISFPILSILFNF